MGIITLRGVLMNELVSESRDLIDEDLAREKFSLVDANETPIWMGSPTFLSYLPRYVSLQ